MDPVFGHCLTAVMRAARKRSLAPPRPRSVLTPPETHTLLVASKAQDETHGKQGMRRMRHASEACSAPSPRVFKLTTTDAEHGPPWPWNS